MITVPDAARRRLEARFGTGVGASIDRAPALVDALARRWGLVLDGTVLYGNSALVMPADRGVLKLHPDTAIAAAEAAALAHPTPTPSAPGRWSPSRRPGDAGAPLPPRGSMGERRRPDV